MTHTVSTAPTSPVAWTDAADADGRALQQAREGRGLSTSDMARRLTLSHKQIEQIESGGGSAFYSARHKVLAMRKYAQAVGVTLAFENAPDDPASVQPPAIAGTLAMARDESGSAAASAAALSGAFTRTAMPIPLPLPRAALTSFALGMLLLAAVVLAFSSARAWFNRFAVPPTPSATAAIAPAGADSGPHIARTSVSPAQAPATCADGHAKSPAHQWTPAYVRKPGNRLYVGGPPGTEVCVADSAGTVSRLVVTAGPYLSVDGQPPYVVSSPALESLQMYLQGMKVRVPPQALAIRLLPGARTDPPEAASAARSPES